MHINDFVKETQDSIILFQHEWYKRHELNPDEYPLEIPDDNSGLWFEFFGDYFIGCNI